MRTLIAGLWRLPGFWIAIFCVGMIYYGCTTWIMRIQQADLQARIDARGLETVRQIDAKVEWLQEQNRILWEQNQRSMRDREGIHEVTTKNRQELDRVIKEMDKVREVIKSDAIEKADGR